MFLKELKSGSDIRGTAIGSPSAPINLTDEAVKAITAAFVVWLAAQNNNRKLKIAIGNDSRLSADRIIAAVTDSLKNAGCDIYVCGLCSTPSMFMMTKYSQTACDGAIMVTASHHPSNKNGLKFFTKSGGLEGKNIDELIALASEGKHIIGDGANIIRRDFMQLYCDGLIAKVRQSAGSDLPLKGFKIVVDAGNGAGAFYALRVLKPLGADINGSQFLEPDGNFPNHIPNPENAAAMDSISKCVLNNKADLGIIFDTDVDRAAVVSSDGTEINRNKLIALISDILLSETKGATIVTDSVTSDGLNKYITARGGVHHRFKRGYRNVIDEAIRLNSAGKNAVLAIETSGHAAFKENYFLDDGAYLVTRLIIKMSQMQNGQALTSSLNDLECAKFESEIRLGFSVPNFTEYGNMVIRELTEHCKNDNNVTIAQSNYEGVRVNISSAEGWFLARMSVHDPILPINIESNKTGGVQQIAQFLYDFLSKYSGVDTVQLQKLANN